MVDLCLFLAILGLAAYAVLGGADFGAGFWDLTAGGPQRGARIRGMVERSMSPVWEANHVWLIFVLVVLWTAFPVFFGSVMSSLYIPLMIVALGIILRGTAFAVRGQAATVNESRGFSILFGLSSLVVPFAMGAAVGGIASGRVPAGNAQADPWSVWLNPTSILIGLLVVASGAFLAAVFLTGDAKDIDEPGMVDAFRTRALGAGAVTVLLAFGGLPVLRGDARSLYDGLLTGGGLACMALFAIFALVTLYLLWTRNVGLARWSAGGAVATIVAGWACVQSPYLLPGKLTIDAAAAANATLQPLLISVAAGLVVLVPSLVWLYRLMLRGDISGEFRPLGGEPQADQQKDSSQ